MAGRSDQGIPWKRCCSFCCSTTFNNCYLFRV